MNIYIAGRASTPFIIICIILFCFTSFFLGKEYIQKRHQDSINQAKFEHAHGYPRGSAPNWKELQTQFQRKKKQEKAKNQETKSQWLTELSMLLKEKRSNEFNEKLVILHNTSSIPSHILVQIRQALIEQVILEASDSKALAALSKYGPRCHIGSSFYDGILDRVLESSSAGPLKSMIDAGCVTGITEKVEKMIQTILSLPEPKRQQMLTAVFSKTFVLEYVISKLLDQGEHQLIVNYIADSVLSKHTLIGSITLLEYVIDKGHAALSEQLLELGVDTVSQQGERKHYALLAALTKENIDVVKKIMRLNPEQLEDKELIRRIDRKITLAHNTNDHYELTKVVTQLLVENNIELSRLDFKGAKLLRQAIREGDLQHVVYLLDNDVDPNRTLGMQTTLSLAAEQQSAESPAIVSVLRKHGALENVLDIIAKERGVSNTENCSIGKAIVNKKVFRAAYAKHKASKNFEVDNTPLDFCFAGIKGCFQSGFGFDDCIQSSPICTSDNSKGCCPNQLNEIYTQARCSGLNITEASQFTFGQIEQQSDQ